MAAPAPLATIFNGDVTLGIGSDVTQFGWGDLNVNRKCFIAGTENTAGTSTSGALAVAGGLSVGKSAEIFNNLNVLYGITNLAETHIDTTLGPTTITGGNALNISVGAASQFVCSSGNLQVKSQTGNLQLYGGANSNNSVDITALNSNGGIKMLSGSLGGSVSLISGSGGISATTSMGNLSLTADKGNGSFLVKSNTDNQNLELSLIGATDSSVKISSEGKSTTLPAIKITSTNTAGNISISNADGLGSGSISMLTGSGGFSLMSNTSGPVSLTSRAASTTMSVNSAGPSQNLTLQLTGNTDSTMFLKSSGTSKAISIETTNVGGNIFITQPALSSGKVQTLTGYGGYIVDTQTGGSVQMTAYGATSLYTNSTLADNQNLTVSVSGNTDSKVIISSSGTGSQAVKIQATAPTGGVYLTANGVVQLESNHYGSGIQIATGTPGVPVHIGTNTSTTTIHGDLNVKGVTTTVESTVVTIDDNIITVNNAPASTSDGGLAIKRYQSANDAGTGDVVSDTADESGTVQNGGNTSTTVKLDITANSTNDYYKGWWIKITGGTGANQVRKIKSYVGSTRIATIYSTADQNTNGWTPVEGMNFSTVLDTSSTYSLFPCHYVLSIWDESRDEFAFVCSGNSPDNTVTPAHYADLHLGGLLSSSIVTNTINGSMADISTVVNLSDAAGPPSSITAFPQNYGIFLVFVKPSSNTTRSHGIFMIGRVNVNSIPGTIVRIISVKGAQYDQLDMQWPANSYPQLMYRPTPLGGSGTTSFNVKIVSL